MAIETMHVSANGQPPQPIFRAHVIPGKTPSSLLGPAIRPVKQFVDVIGLTHTDGTLLTL